MLILRRKYFNRLDPYVYDEDGEPFDVGDYSPFPDDKPDWNDIVNEKIVEWTIERGKWFKGDYDRANKSIKSVVDNLIKSLEEGYVFSDKTSTENTHFLWRLGVEIGNEQHQLYKPYSKSIDKSINRPTYMVFKPVKNGLKWEGKIILVNCTGHTWKNKSYIEEDRTKPKNFLRIVSSKNRYTREYDYYLESDKAVSSDVEVKAIRKDNPRDVIPSVMISKERNRSQVIKGIDQESKKKEKTYIIKRITPKADTRFRYVPGRPQNSYS